MISYKRISIINSDADIIVCSISSDGILSNKLSQTLLLKHPPLIDFSYMSLQKGELRYIPTQDQRMICLFPTKAKANDNESYDYIIEGLKVYNRKTLNYEKLYSNPKSVAFPQLGIIDNNDDWIDIKIIMEQFLDELEQTVYIHINKADRQLATDKRKK